jgi:signal transduction histidine kinase
MVFKRMILIVDDNQENIFSLKTLLELHNFSVDTASSGEEALKRVLKNTYSLIVLDVQMPGMDGFEVAEAISGYSKSKDIPIIFLSAINIHKSYIKRGYASGGVDYVTKPFDADILLLKIRTFYRLSEQKRKLIEMDKFLREEIEFRKKVEGELEQKVEELKSTLESLPHMAFTTCSDGRIEFVNNHWYEYSESATDFPLAEDYLIEEYVQQAITGRGQLVQEVKIKLLAATEYRFHVFYLTPVWKGDEIVRWVGIFTDIHDQKMASQVLEKRVEERTHELKNINKKLENSNVELQKFAFVASHDLQEPLRKIQLFSDLVLEKFAGDRESANKFLHKIIASAERMRKLITSLLDYSRLPDKNFYESVDLNEIIGEIIQDYEVPINARNAKITVNKLPVLDAIPGQMHQIFQNLISNALKFSRADCAPEITISADRIQDKSLSAPVAQDGDYYRILFSDNGIGFDQMYADKVFEIFQRLKQFDDYEGTGIGLAIVKKIVERHEGIVAVKSKENEGTVFTLILPVNQHL